MKYQTHTLKNGIRLIHKPTSSIVAHAGVFINTGSRDEDEDEHGMAHFIEHMIFKGTHKRKAWHIISRLEDVGGDLNAYTSKEETCVHASFLCQYYDRAIELFSDILFNSVFPEEEVEKEKDVIVEEINSYRDSPSEQIVDDFEGLVFSGHALGRNILGSADSLKEFTGKKADNFIHRKYHTSEMVIASVGHIPFSKLKSIAEEHFGKCAENHRVNRRKIFTDYKTQYKKIKTDTYQTHCITGGPAFNFYDDRRTGLFLLNNILGGPGMNSRLNLALREKSGYAYNIESYYTPYSDTGIVDIYFGTDPGNLEKCTGILMKELEKIRTVKLGNIQLSRAKRQLTGLIAISGENNAGYLQSMGKSFLVFNKVDSIPEISRKIEAVTAEQIIDIANEIFDPKMISTLIFEK
ncbi:MAG: pitrilysin family protein [Bacteroidia bacterium]|nr:pitrilysin family protein [Bacteroidia bacterium]